MDISLDRRRFLIAGAAAITTVTAGSAYLWWESTNGSRQPANDAIKVVPGGAAQPVPVASPAAADDVLPVTSAVPDGDTEARLSRLTEDDAASSRQRMRERQERRSDAVPPVAENANDADRSAWGP